MPENPPPAQIPFSEAKSTVMTFGKHNGKTLDQIAEDDSGLLYLDWLFGEMVKGAQFGRKARVYDALKVYMNDKSIKQEIQDVMRSRGR